MNEDINDILTVYRECEDFLSLGPMSVASLKMVQEDLLESNKTNGQYCVIISDNEIIGIVDFIRANYMDSPQNAYISLMMISKKHRGLGIGHNVLKEIENSVLSNIQIKNIITSVQTNNESAINFWTKNGYERIGEAELKPHTTIVYHLCKKVNSTI